MAVKRVGVAERGMLVRVICFGCGCGAGIRSGTGLGYGYGSSEETVHDLVFGSLWVGFGSHRVRLDLVEFESGGSNRVGF